MVGKPGQKEKQDFEILVDSAKKRKKGKSLRKGFRPSTDLERWEDTRKYRERKQKELRTALREYGQGVRGAEERLRSGIENTFKQGGCEGASPHDQLMWLLTEQEVCVSGYVELLPKEVRGRDELKDE